MMQIFRKLTIRRSFRTIAIVVAVVLCLIISAVALLPALISNQFAQARIKSILATAMKRQVDWHSLQMSWTQGVSLAGLKLGTGPVPLLSCSIAELKLVPTLGRDNGKFYIDLQVQVRDVKAEMAPSPPVPKPYKEPLTAIAEALQKMEGLGWPLPVDLRARVEVAPLQLVYRNPVTGKDLLLKDFAFRVDLPSLAARPIVIALGGDVAVGGKGYGWVKVQAKVAGLVPDGSRIRPAAAVITADAEVPGASLTVRGGLSTIDGFRVNGRFDLPLLLGAARPLLPAKVPSLEGVVDVDLQAHIVPSRDLHLALMVGARKLAASGGALQNRRVGPIDLFLKQQIATDHERQRVEFTNGGLDIPGLITAAWGAAVDRPSLPKRAVAAHLGPVRIDLQRALAVAEPFLPKTFPVRELQGTAQLESVAVKLNGPKNDGEVRIAGLRFDLPRLRLELANGPVRGEGLELELKQLQAPLKAMRPTRANAALAWGGSSLAVAGKQPVRVQGLRGAGEVLLTDINLKSRSPRKVAASLELRQSLELASVAVGKDISIDRLREQLRLLAKAGESGVISVILPEFRVEAARVAAAAAGKRLIPFPLVAQLTADGIRIAPPGQGLPSLERATVAITLGDALRLAATGSLSSATPHYVKTKGTIDGDLGRIAPLVAPFLPAGLKALGNLSAAWDLALPLPDKPLPKEKQPLRLARASLGLLERGDVTINFQGSSLRLPTAKGAITCETLTTPKPLQLVVGRRGASVSFAGNIRFAGVSGIPGSAGKLPPQGGSLTLSGELSDWSRLRLAQELRLDRLGVAQVAELTLDRIDSLLDEKAPFNTATLMKRLDATLFAHLDAAFSREFKPLLAGMDLSGTAGVGGTVHLTAGRDLRLRAYLESRDLGVRMDNGTAVEGLRTDLVVERTYGLAAKSGDSWLPLSTSLVRPLADLGLPPGAAEVAGRVREDLRGEVRGPRKVTARKFAFRSGKLPVELTAVEADLLLNPEEAGLSFLQAEAMGGTIRTRAMVDLRPELPTFSSSVAFSHLDSNYLLPADARQKAAAVSEDTELTGDLTLDTPLATGQRDLLEGLRLKMNIYRIGSRTLERALFSLDPYERNEKLVAQRKLLRNGTLKWLRAGTVDGAFSLDGEAEVKGVKIALPRVERLRLSELPIRKETASAVAGIVKVRGLLDLLRADMLVVAKDGKVMLKSKNRVH